ncbi:hypothetical protein E2562_028125 [Oryza meyeriana var. granulata]|uniref:Uncharacterized protein n=1 Tax=Oryza meyeriana var. granulata TaxID=110450 RepID=A0A6G1C8L6_9ORYZ|nr:hypothetical protein E2562_028125 [Oryza meyeriana var. granulata]
MGWASQKHNFHVRFRQGQEEDVASAAKRARSVAASKSPTAELRGFHRYPKSGQIWRAHDLIQRHHRALASPTTRFAVVHLALIYYIESSPVHPNSICFVGSSPASVASIYSEELIRWWIDKGLGGGG